MCYKTCNPEGGGINETIFGGRFPLNTPKMTRLLSAWLLMQGLFPSVLLILEVHLGATLLLHYEATVVSVNKPVTVSDVSVKRWVPPC